MAKDYGVPSEAIQNALLGCPDAGEMLVKAQLVSKIAEIIQRRGLTQVEAAELPGLTQPKVSAMLRGQVQGQEPTQPRSSEEMGGGRAPA